MAETPAERRARLDKQIDEEAAIRAAELAEDRARFPGLYGPDHDAPPHDPDGDAARAGFGLRYGYDTTTDTYRWRDA